MNVVPRRLERERRWLLIRLQNNGYSDTSLQEYLRNHQGVESNGEVYVQKSKLLAIVGRAFDDFFQSFLKCCNQTNDKVPLQPFLCFLQNGTLPIMSAVETVKHEKSCDFVQINDDTSTAFTVKGESTEKTAEAVWKKHETVIQERIVVYVSIDKEGVTHKVTETDKTQKDIIHVENSSGVFAHREYTQQEQTEDMDEEEITFIRATEEYIHLKRDDDEYEYVHSEVPPAPTEFINEDVDDEDDEDDD